jgi:hypothetical protein
MPASRPDHGADPLPLEGLADPPTSAQGRTELAVRSSIAAAHLDNRDGGAAELAAQAARAVDLAHNRRDPYAVAACVRELREVLTRLRLDPVARLGNDAGEVQRFLESLGTPE